MCNTTSLKFITETPNNTKQPPKPTHKSPNGVILIFTKMGIFTKIQGTKSGRSL